MVLSGPMRRAGENVKFFEVPVLLRLDAASRPAAVESARQIAAALEASSDLASRVDPVATDEHPMLGKLGIDEKSTTVPLILELEGVNRAEAIQGATDVVPLKIPADLRRRVLGFEIVDSQDEAYLTGLGVVAAGRNLAPGQG